MMITIINFWSIIIAFPASTCSMTAILLASFGLKKMSSLMPVILTSSQE